uniref:Eph LBD domain-containing protein n=1 Tax=Clytia hemisphaerica TaxID=252671 RepID=A0A7M5XLI5_9CNID
MELCFKILIFTSLLHHLSSEKVSVSNVFGRTGLTEDWTRYNNKCVGTQVWFFNTNDRNTPKYEVCLTSGCLLETASYEVKSARTVYADASFTGRLCNSLTPQNPKCGENITVNAIIVDIFPNSPNSPTEKEILFPISDNIKVPLFNKKGKRTGFYEAEQTFTFENKLDKTFIRYLFESKMACGSITSFKVYYYKCPSVSSSLAVFGDIYAPSYLKNVKEYQGKCVDNALQVGDESLTMRCMWNGTVASTTGQCICLQGYQKEANQCQSK